MNNSKLNMSITSGTHHTNVTTGAHHIVNIPYNLPI